MPGERWGLCIVAIPSRWQMLIKNIDNMLHNCYNICMTSPNVDPSKEVLGQGLIDFVIANDWRAAYEDTFTRLCNVQAELKLTEDPDDIILLVQKKHQTIHQVFGSGWFLLAKDNMVTQRAQFDAEFGER